MSPEGTDHAWVASKWRDHLGAYALSHPEVVEAVFSSPWVRIDDETERIGDIGVYLAREGPTWEVPDRAPDLMFEFVSRSSRDRKRDYEEKRSEYERLGIREYVIVDRFKRKVTVLAQAPDGYREQVLGPADAYASPLLPGLAIPLAEAMGR